MHWLKWFLLLVVFSLLLTYIVIPLVANWVSGFRVRATKLSPLSARGLEWYQKHNNSSLPSLRIERMHWTWGGTLSSRITLNIEGVTVRIRKKTSVKKPKLPKKKKKIPPQVQRLLNYFFHFLVLNWANVAAFFAIRVVDIKVIVEDLQDVEITVSNVKLAITREPQAPPPSTSFNPDEDVSPQLFASPPMSPSVCSEGVGGQWPSVVPLRSPTARRMESFHRRASSIHTTVSKTASHIWSHAIGSAVDRVTFSLSVSDVAVLLPRSASPVAASNSLPHLSQKSSNGSLNASAPRGFDPISSLLKLRQYSPLGIDEGYEKLLAIENESTLTTCIGFGPNRPILTENNVRADVNVGPLHLSLDGVEKLQALAELRPRAPRRAPPPEFTSKPSIWEPSGLPRIVLHSLEKASISLAKVYVSHLLPVALPLSTASSATELSADNVPAPERPFHTLSLDFTNVYLSAEGTSNRVHSQLVKLFGTNTSPQSLVRGVKAELRWTAIELQCIAPGETSNDKTQLVAIRQGKFDLLSTWRPAGWQWHDLVFGDDPNLSVVSSRGHISSIDIASDLQLVSELEQAWSQQKPPPKQKTPREPKARRGLLPRLRLLLDTGPISIVLANRASKDEATVTLATDGISMGCHSTYADLPPPRPSAQSKVDDTENLMFTESPAGSTFSAPSVAPSISSSAQATINTDDGYSDAGTHTEVLQSATGSQAGDDAAAASPPPLMMSLRMDANVAVDPISLRMSLGSRNEKTYRVATLGRVVTTVCGDVSASEQVGADGVELYTLLPETLTSYVEVLCEDGLRVELWHKGVIDALVQLANMKEPSPPKPPSNLLDKLPSGVTLRVALENVSVFVGHEDPNPNCDLRNVHGIWLQTMLVVNYAHYKPTGAKARCRHLSDQSIRDQFSMYDDITAQAYQMTEHLEAQGGDAALFTVLVHHVHVRSVYNGAVFVAKGGADRIMPKDDTTVVYPPPHVGEEYVWWGRRGAQSNPAFKHNHVANKGDFDSRSFLRLPINFFTISIRRTRPDGRAETSVTCRIERVQVVGYISDIYCSLLAAKTITKVAEAFKRPPVPAQPVRTASPLSFSLLVPTVWVHFTFPLKDELFVSMAQVNVDKPLDKVMAVAASHVLVHVQSATNPGMWDELGLIKRLSVAIDPSKAIKVQAVGMRIRIPHAFMLSQLILNINVCFKAVKLLAGNLKSNEFHTVRLPVSEAPKMVPNLTIEVALLHLEARDNPVENKINLANRVGLMEQRSRLQLEDMFEHKLSLLSDPETRPINHLTTNSTVSASEARYRLDWHISRNWIKRMKRAKEYERRREESFHSKMAIKRDRLPIRILPLEQTTPLFRAAFSTVSIKLAPPALSRSEIIDYMGRVSAPFSDDVGFTLMVPFEFDWSMGETKVSLRDYPLPVLRIEPAAKGPSWRVTTLFVIAEELAGEDSCLFIPCEVLPEQAGDSKAKPLWVQIAKTINPVKTYARPKVKIYAPEATKITWCNSYSAGYSELSRMFDKLSSPPRDPSPKLGFWDKMRLVLHWRVRMEFASSVRFYLKGSADPYLVTGYGSGFALVLRRNVAIEVCQPNREHETVQFMADELLVSIPDLAYLHDAAAVGTDTGPEDINEVDRLMIERRSVKPCARFMNGVRFGLGFGFERTCRPWTCHGCGETDNLLHRQCRLFQFRPHNSVVLRSPQAIERMEAQAGHAIDSYEAFRSDYIHFSVSLVAPRENEGVAPRGTTAETHNSLHLSPKAFAHFFAWWGLFSSKIPAPIRQGPLFADTPPPSKKFGRSMGTIKYRMDLAPVYLSHMYNQVAEDLWAQGRAQSLGCKLRIRRLRCDGHQRMQETRQWNKELGNVKVITHKPFYAVDVLLDQIQIVGVVADFEETTPLVPEDEPRPPPTEQHPKASELPPDQREWFNSFDFIDADRKPFDRDPRMEIVDLGDCPHVSLSRRVRCRRTMPDHDDDTFTNDMEASKFGHEKTHVCYLGAALGIGPMQQQIAQERVDELQNMLDHLPPATVAEERNPRDIRQTINHRIATLNHHIDDLDHRERRHIDDNTLEQNGDDEYTRDADGDPSFENTVHVHCPRLFINNKSRNLLYKYNYSHKNRRKEDYTTSHASLRGIRDGINRRLVRKQNGLNKDDLPEDLQGVESGNALLEQLEALISDNAANRFKLGQDFVGDKVDLRRTALGIPEECHIHPHWRAIVLKPQMSFRSNAEPDAVVLVAVEEVSFQGFAIRDPIALDHVSMKILSRNYIALRGLQAFYPTKEVLQRNPQTSAGSGSNRQLDFVPLEVFLDVRSETTEYERIVLKTDMGMSMDQFNDLRVPRGLEWPKAVNEHGEPINHLRRHQNCVAVSVPMVTVSATPTHYSALYYIITDLLMYKDPQTAALSEKINNFMYRFDQRDRDPQQLLLTLFIMQQHIRNLTELQRGYEANLYRLTDQGKAELFKIRTDLLHESESLFTVFEVINANRARDDAQANARTLSRVDVRAGNIAWHMLRENGDPLVKLNIKHTIGLMEHNQDGSSDNALVMGDLQALNSNADAVFPEVISRYDKDWPKSSKRYKSNSYISTILCLFPQVGGIGIIRQFAFYVHPTRFRLEQEVGSSLVDYVFNDKTGRRPKLNKKDTKAAHKEDKDKDKDLLAPAGDDASALSRTVSPNTLAVAAPANGRNRSATVVSAATNDSARSTPLDNVPDMDAAEMRRRANMNRTFISVLVGSTILVLDYKRDDNRKHTGLTWPECVDFRLQAPQLEYHDEILTFKELFDKVKVDIRSYALSQTGNLLGQVFKKTSVFRSKKSLRQIAGINTEMPTFSKRASPKSPLRFTVQPGTPLEIDEFGNTTNGHASAVTGPHPNTMFRSISRRSDGGSGHGSRPSIGSSIDTLGDDADNESPGSSHYDRPRRGLMGRLRKSSKQDDMEVLDDLSQNPYIISPPERTVSLEPSLLSSAHSSSRGNSTHSGSSSNDISRQVTPDRGR